MDSNRLWKKRKVGQDFKIKAQTIFIIDYGSLILTSMYVRDLLTISFILVRKITLYRV